MCSKSQHHYLVMRNQSIEILRVLCAFLVVGIHVTPNPANMDQISVLIFDSITRVGLPIFFVISGYFLLSEKDDGKSIFKKVVDRSTKLLIPFACFLLVDMMLRKGISLPSWEAVNFYITTILNGASRFSAHYWFVYSMLGLYVIYPVLTYVLRKLTGREFFILIALLFSIKAYQVYFPIILPNFAYTPRIAFPALDTWFLYFLLGRAIYLLPKKDYQRYAVIGFIVSVVATALAIKAGQAFKPYDMGLNMYLMAGAMMYMFHSMSINQLSPILNWVVSFVSKNTYGIYLIHIFVLQVIAYKYLDLKPIVLNSPAIGVPVVTVIIFLISLVISAAINFVMVDRFQKLLIKKS